MNTKRPSKKLRYIAYVRKSSESKERQELSHISQIENIKKDFADLNIVRWMEPESRSAFTPGRPIFNEMIEAIKNDEADGIIAWHPNRLSRNEIDSAQITFLLRSSLKDLKFSNYNFDNSAEGIMNLQSTMNHSQYESTKQGDDVGRGMETKASKGERPGRVPVGYVKVPITDSNGQYILHKKENRIKTETGIDAERWDDVKRMWDYFLSGKYTPNEIWRIAIEDMKFTTRKTSQTGGKLITKSQIYRILRNPFYAGYFEHNGTLNKVSSKKYKPMITWEEYKTAQQILGERGNRRVGKFDYAFSSMIRCGECGCLVQARHRTKYIKSEGAYRTYVYYYCSRKSLDRPCTQTKYTLVEDIEKDIDMELTKYTIMPEFKELALQILRKNNRNEVAERNRTYENDLRQRKQFQENLDKLMDSLLSGDLSKNEYQHHKNRYKTELDEIDTRISRGKRLSSNDMKANEDAFDFAVNARHNFTHGDIRTKRDILSTLGKRFILTDNKLHIEPNEWLIPIGENYPDIERGYIKVRTNQKASPKELEEALGAKMQTWRARRDLNPRHPA